VSWTGTQPSLPIGNGAVGISFFVAIRALVDSGGGWLWSCTDGNQSVVIDSGSHFQVRTGAVAHTAETTAYATGTKFSFGATWVYGGTGTYYRGLESGSLAADGTFGESSDGTTQPLASFGGFAGQGSCRGTYYLAAWFSNAGGALTLSDFQALHTDPIGTLFTTATGLPWWARDDSMSGGMQNMGGM
jgi:hypothetical protein